MVPTLIELVALLKPLAGTANIFGGLTKSERLLILFEVEAGVGSQDHQQAEAK
jgi:hypothetical protein